MYHDQNTLNEFLGEHDSFHFPTGATDRALWKTCLELKQPEEPINNAYPLKVFNAQSPCPFKQNLFLYFDEEEVSLQNHPQISSLNFEDKMFSQVLNFDESPRKRQENLNIVSSIKVGPRNPHNHIFLQDTRYGKKNSKGLRNLSLSVYKIVLELKKTTYKEVAAHLVKMLNSGEFGPIDEHNSKAKDEQNIKRRVYDALNVLISADVLKKHGKSVISDQEFLMEKVKIPKKNGKKEDCENLGDQILKKERDILEKKEKARELRNKKEILNAILKRNGKKKHPEMDKIPFPLVGLISTTLPKPATHDPTLKLVMPVSNVEQVFGDLDLLAKAGIDVLNENIEEVIEGTSEGEAEEEHLLNRKTREHPRVLYSL